MKRIKQSSGKTATNNYPSDWKQISDRICAEHGRCIRCGHPYVKKKYGRGQWTPCDVGCHHAGPTKIIDGIKYAEWRILTVHHFDGLKNNCEWFNLLALCQRCHLKIQAKVDPEQPWMFEHSEWIKPYVAGFYAWKYEGKKISREEAAGRLEELLNYELRA